MSYRTSSIIKFSLIVLFFIAPLPSLFSQNMDTCSQSDCKYTAEADAGYGFILPHHRYFYYLMENHPYTIDIHFTKKLSGNKEWHQLFRYPSFGYGFHFADLGNKEYLGKSFAGYGTIDIPIVQSKTFSFNYSISAGFSFLSKYFDIDDHYYSLPIGSNGNVFFRLTTGIRYKICDHTFLYNHIGITHYSNGAYAMPNSGINVVTASAGFSHAFGNSTSYKYDLPDHKKSNRFEFILSTGIKEISPPTGEKFMISSLVINAKRQFWRKRSFGIGLDNFYDPSINVRLERDSTETDFFSACQTGLHISHDLCFGNTSITMQMGYYIRTIYKTNGMVYSRYGIQHILKNRYILSIALKTHFFKADFIEWGMGYLISR